MDKTCTDTAIENEKENRKKKDFTTPRCTSHNPLEIMSGWEDHSSDLEF